MSAELLKAVKSLLDSRGETVETLFGTAATVGVDELLALARVFDDIGINCKKKITIPSDSDVCNRVFEHWVMRMNKQPGRCKLNAKRKTVINKMLKEGYTVDDMIGAIDGCARSKYHMGDNNNGTVYNSLELIFRDGEKLEQFRDNVGVVIQAGNLKTNASNDKELSTRDMSLHALANDRSWAD